MNLVAYGSENLLFNGNPKKTFFKATYQKYSNFGLQRFRIDYEGTKDINTKTGTTLDFKIPRYAEMLYDTYFVFNLPNINKLKFQIIYKRIEILANIHSSSNFKLFLTNFKRLNNILKANELAICMNTKVNVKLFKT